MEYRSWIRLQQGMEEAAEKTVGHVKKTRDTYNTYSAEIQELSEKQKLERKQKEIKYNIK